jgi:hypothetical protein
MDTIDEHYPGGAGREAEAGGDSANRGRLRQWQEIL